jgi:hypothetical protein
VERWSKFGGKDGQNLVERWSKFGGKMDKIWWKDGQNLVERWSKFGGKMVKIWLHLTRREKVEEKVEERWNFSDLKMHAFL